MNPDQARRLDEVLHTIQRKWGTHALHRATSADRAVPLATLSTGYPALDGLLDIGGLPRGHMSEWIGIPTSGAHTVALATLGTAQARGEETVYFDLDSTFHPTYAQSHGVTLGELLLVRPHSIDEALAIALDLLRSGGSGVLVWDALPAPGTTSREAMSWSTALQRFAQPLAASAWVFLFLNRAGSPMLGRHASVRLGFTKTGWRYEHRNIVGYEVRVKVLRNRFGPEGRHVPLSIQL